MLNEGRYSSWATECVPLFPLKGSPADVSKAMLQALEVVKNVAYEL